MSLNIPKNPGTLSSVTPKMAPRVSHATFEVMLLVIVAVLFYFFLLLPKRNELEAKKDSIVQLTLQKEQIEKENNNVQNLLDQMKRNRKNIAKLDEALPLDSRPTKVYLLLNDIINRSGMSVLGLSIPEAGNRVIAGNPDAVNNPYTVSRKVNEYRINMGLSGSFEQFLAVLQRIETSGRIFDVTSVEIAASEDDKVDFQITLTTYFYE